MSAVEGCWRQWCISAEDCSVLRQRVGDKGSKQQRHVSQISSACCLRNGCTPEPLWDARGCVFCGGGWRTHTHTVSCWGCHSLCAAASQFYIHSQFQQACEDEEKCFPFLWILRLFLLFSFLEAGLQCVFIRELLDAHHSFVLFLLFFSPCGCTSGWVLNHGVFFALLDIDFQSWEQQPHELGVVFFLIEDRCVTATCLSSNCQVDENGCKSVSDSLVMWLHDQEQPPGKWQA